MADNEEYVTVRYHKRVARWTQILAIFTLLLTLATALGSYISIRDAKQAFFSTRRPVLSLSEQNAFDFSWHWEGSVKNIVGYNFGISMQNSGETPATNAKISSGTYLTDTSFADTSLKSAPMPAFDASSVVIGAKSGYEYWTYVPNATLLDVASGKKRLFIILRAEYQDIFGTGNTYHFTTCEEVFVDADRDALLHPTTNTDLSNYFELKNCGNLNNAD
jgi:hypothetical protein